jgi:hypothetical protein
MEILNFEGNGANRSPKKRARIATLVGGAFLLAAIGSTFAANVTINGGSAIEYGQGLTQATACDDAIKITPTNHFVNSAGASGLFYIDTVTVTDSRTVSTSTGLANCVGKSIKLSAFNNVSGAAALFTCTFSNITYSSPSVSASVANCPAGAVITSYHDGGTPGERGLQLAFSNPASAPNVQAGVVYKFTLESF